MVSFSLGASFGVVLSLPSSASGSEAQLPMRMRAWVVLGRGG